MPLMEEYEQRTAWKYEPIRGQFSTHTGLDDKVGPDGSFRYFPGTTAVFRLDRDTFRLARLMQAALHSHLEDTGMLAEPLPESTLHMTLHDLVSPPPGGGGEGYAGEAENSLTGAVAVVSSVRERYAGQEIVMLPDRIVNMVSKSLVLLLKPATERDFSLLLQMYRAFDAVRPLPYPLTPHITLAYFRPGPIDGDRLGALIGKMQPVPGALPVCRFTPEALTAQSFPDMAHYRDVPARICFTCDGGMNRSVMCAAVLNHMAKERGLPLRAEARSAFPNTHGRAIPGEVWSTLERHGIGCDLPAGTARYLDDKDFAAFTGLAAVSEGAFDRFAMLGLPENRYRALSGIFYGIRDPAYGSSYEEAFADIAARMERLFADGQI